MNVPPKHHRHFVARRAEVINQISAEYNGVTVTFPQVNSNSSEVLIRGHKDFVEKVKNKINSIVIDLVIKLTNYNFINMNFIIIICIHILRNNALQLKLLYPKGCIEF